MAAAPGSDTATNAARRARTLSIYGVLLLFGASVGLPGPAVPSLQAEYGLSYAGAALHLTMFSAGSAVASFADGWLANRASQRSLLRAALTGVLTAATVTGLAPSVAISIAGTVAMGVCATVALNIAHGAIGADHGDDRGTALANAHLFAALGLVVGAASVGLARTAGQWRLAYAIPAVLAATLLMRGVASHLTGGGGDPEDTDPQEVSVPVAVWIGGVVLALSVGVEWAVTFWAASFLREPVGLAPTSADTLTVAVLGALVIGRWLLGRLTVRFNDVALLRIALIATAVVAAPYLLGPRLGPPYGVVVPVAALIALCTLVTMLFPLALSVTMATAGPTVAEQQRASATALFAGAAGAIVTPYALGAVADAASLTTALLVLPVGAGLTLAGVALMRRPRFRRSTAAPH